MLSRRKFLTLSVAGICASFAGKLALIQQDEVLGYYKKILYEAIDDQVKRGVIDEYLNNIVNYESYISRSIRGYKSYLKLIIRKVMWIKDPWSQFYDTEDRIKEALITSFLMSTDYFYIDDKRKTSFIGVFQPLERYCANPFAQQV